MTQIRLEEFKGYNKISMLKNTSTPSINLLQRFQRLLIAKIYTKDSNCIHAAESLLKKYLQQLTVHVVETLTICHQICMTNVKNYLYVAQILRDDIMCKYKMTLMFKN